MRAIALVLFLAACSQQPEQVALEYPSPEPSSGIVERACPDAATEMDTYVAPDGRIYQECKPRDQSPTSRAR